LCVAGISAIQSTCLVQAFQTIASQPDSSPSLCYEKLINLKEAYLDGKPFQRKFETLIVSFLDGTTYREYPWLAKKSEHEIALVAQEVALMLPAALHPFPLEPVLEKWKRHPEQGWIKIDTAAVNAAQSTSKHAKLVDTPNILDKFATTTAARELATATLQKLNTACALLPSDRYSTCRSGEDVRNGGLSELYLYGQADFGVQTIINAASDSSGTSNTTTGSAMHPADLLNAMLTTATATSKKNKSNAGSASSGPENALEFRHLTLERSSSYSTDANIENTTSDAQSIWVLGGFAAPQLPSTFTTIDSARLFWSDRGNSSIKLEPGQQHSLTIALCRLNSAERGAESGILHQALVVFIAVGKETVEYSELARIQNASFVDVYNNYNSSKRITDGGSKTREQKAAKNYITNSQLGIKQVAVGEDGNASGITFRIEGKGTKPVATLGSPQSPIEQPLYRIFACARRVSVALLDTTQVTATTQLRVEAKPFIPPRWRQAFDAQPEMYYATFPVSTMQLLAVDSEIDRALEPAASKKSWATRTHMEIITKQTQQQYEAENFLDRGGSDIDTEPRIKEVTNFKFQHPVLRKYQRLLHLEELAKEQDICRHDVYNAKLHLAVFAHSNQRKFTEVRLPDQPGGRGEGSLKISKGMYRGPSINYVFPNPLFKRSEISCEYHPGSDDNVYVLGMLRHPGLSEGRPSLVIGDAVHLRPVFNPNAEIVCLVASIDGDIVHLVMPEDFWNFSSLENSIQECAAKLPAGGGSSSSTKTAVTLENVPKEAFNGRVHVRFSFDRRPFIHMQNALRAADWKSSSICFVPAINSEIVKTENNAEEKMYDLQRYSQPSLAQVEEIESKVELLCGRSGAPLNTEQRHAVSALVAGAGRASPYALHGPPGTGKTVTMVSAALQLLSTYPEARLLLCAPQNYSADLLCSALAAAGLSKTRLLRLNDPRRPPYSAKEDTMDFTSFNAESGLFEVPHSLEQLQSYSVVVCTCTAAALLYPYYHPLNGGGGGGGGGSQAGFTHVLIDESGQALLPEALIPLVLLTPPPSSNCYDKISGWGALLCGDPQQLGPTVHSLAASASGLSSSLLERLISFHRQSSTTLLQAGLVPSTSMLLANYRSHASLLNLPSKLFYRGQLVAAADPDSVLPPQWKETMDTSANAEEKAEEIENKIVEDDDDGGALGKEENDKLNTVSASLMFYGVHGQQMREGDIPSYHNPLEAAAIADLVQGLLNSKHAGVKLTDIGIMATYRRQVQSIRFLLRQRGLGQVRVGTVDDYQGQEERIVFISLVNSSGQQSSSQSNDAQYLGLWNNPKRFNVAITRAKALLVVVGHPAVLLEDPNWKELLRHCASKGAFRGVGADAIAERLGVDLIRGGDFIDSLKVTTHQADSNQDSGENTTSASGTELMRTIDQMASLALLGVGDTAQMFPETLEEAYASYADEMEWRVML
jgi:putative helicase MOV10L1